MSELRCTECGIEAGYADANIADVYNTCGGTDVPSEVEASDGSVKFDYSNGGKHSWVEQQ